LRCFLPSNVGTAVPLYVVRMLLVVYLEPERVLQVVAWLLVVETRDQRRTLGYV
jgi:hypothetical protein